MIHAQICNKSQELKGGKFELAIGSIPLVRLREEHDNASRQRPTSKNSMLIYSFSVADHGVL